MGIGAGASASAPAIAKLGATANQVVLQTAQRTVRPLGSRAAGFTSKDALQEGQSSRIDTSAFRLSFCLRPVNGSKTLFAPFWRAKALEPSRLSIRCSQNGTEVDVIRFENVGLRYGGGPEVLKDVSFRIEPKSFQFLTGPSGAGKSSLLRLALLALKPARGLISLFGRDTAQLGADDVARLRRRIGIVFQDFRLLDHLTVFENVALPLRVLGRDEGDYRKQVQEVVRWIGLGERISAMPPALSGGEKQRAAIARALIVKPEVLLADEPTGSVDPALAERLLRVFTELPSTGTSVLLATHDIALMNRVDARRLVLAQGRLQIDG